jgi:hypothetical protein
VSRRAFESLSVMMTERTLSRIASAMGNALAHEARQRHAEILVDELGLTKGSWPEVSTSTEGVRREEGQCEVGEKRRCRAIAARANRLAQDRADTQVAANDTSRVMSESELEGWRKAERSGRCLIFK